MKGLFVIAFEGFSILVESPFFGSRIRWLILVAVVTFAFSVVFALVLPVATSVTTPVIALWLVPEAPSWPLVAVTVLASVPKTPAWPLVPLVVLTLWLAVTIHFLCLWYVAVK